MAKYEPTGVVVKVDSAAPLHAELRARAGMPQKLEVRMDGKLLHLSGILVGSRTDPRPYGTMVLDFQAKKAKPKKAKK